MKVLVILLVAIVASTYTLPTQVKDVSKEWEEFKTKYGKNYSSSFEEQRRFEIFKNNLAEIEHHNELFQKGETTYTQGVNSLADWLEIEISQFINKNFKIPKTPSGYIFNKTETLVLPESVDWRSEGVVSEVQDQIISKCGSCWSFAATGAVEAQYALKNGKLVTLSKQNVMDCVASTGYPGCELGSIDLAFQSIGLNGVESEEDYPYEATNGFCRFDASKMVTKLVTYVDIPAKNELALQEVVAIIGPIAAYIDFSVQTGFLFYKSGIYDGYCSTTLSTHAVLVVGFGSENGNDFYIIKNSFGPDWGESGYFRIKRNVGDECCLAFGGTYPVL